MINWIHSRLRRPERGWDPISEAHAVSYARGEWQPGARQDLVNLLEEWINGFDGKTVLDLGGGPGQYSVAFAKRGAHVTWHDISQRYRLLAAQKASEAGVQIQFSMGYMDDAKELLRKDFDLVFNRVCWNYGRGDASFAQVIYSLVKPGGIGYIDTTHCRFKYDTLPLHARARVWLNNSVGWKIGHPFPPHGRIAYLLLQMPLEKLLVDYSGEFSDRILFQRRRVIRPELGSSF